MPILKADNPERAIFQDHFYPFVPKYLQQGQGSLLCQYIDNHIRNNLLLIARLFEQEHAAVFLQCPGWRVGFF